MITYCSNYPLLTPEHAEEISQPGPDSLQCIAVHLADPVAVVIARVLPAVMADRGVPAAVPCTAPTRRCTPSPPAWWRARPSGGPPPPPHSDLESAALTAGRRADRRPVGGPGAVALDLVRPPPWRVVGIEVRHAFFPPHFGTSRRPRRGRPAAARARAWTACRSRSRCWRLTPTSRASLAVGTPWAVAGTATRAAEPVAVEQIEALPATGCRVQ